jgi:Leucine-rich repeat (LRR) protein
LQFIGNLKKLMHFDASSNNIKWIAPEIGSCCSLTDLTLSCNEIQVSALSSCSSRIILKLLPYLLNIMYFDGGRTLHMFSE